MLFVCVLGTPNLVSNAIAEEFSGQTFQDTTIIIANQNHFSIHNNTFINSTLRITINYDTDETSNFAVSNNTFLDGSLLIVFGSTINKTAIHHFEIHGNIIEDSVKIGVAYCSDGRIYNNTIHGCEHGIATRSAANITIEQNSISDIEGYGIYVGTGPGSGTSNVTIHNNTVRNASIGIGKWYGSEERRLITVNNNTFTNCRSYDLMADFPAVFQENVLTGRDKLVVLDCAPLFFRNKDRDGCCVQPADVNGDSKVDIRDVSLVSRSFGQNKTDIIDVVSSGMIDICDIVFVSRHFGIIG